MKLMGTETELPSRTFKVLDSHQRMLDRQAVREENQRRETEAMEASMARRKRESVHDRVEVAERRLRGATPVQAVQLIEALSDHDRDFYLLAEERGENRKDVLRRFPGVRKAVRLAYEGETPDTTEAQEGDTSTAQPVAKAPRARKPKAQAEE